VDAAKAEQKEEGMLFENLKQMPSNQSGEFDKSE